MSRGILAGSPGCDPGQEGSLMRFLRLCLAIPMLLASTEKPQHVAPKGPLVHLTSGTLEGALRGNIAVFEGVPFAMPPVGALRWREPQPVASWSRVRDATKPSHPCMQNVAGTDNFIEPLAATYGVAYSRQTLDPSEDCLYLNVWTPQLQPGAHLPVTAQSPLSSRSELQPTDRISPGNRQLPAPCSQSAKCRSGASPSPTRSSWGSGANASGLALDA